MYKNNDRLLERAIYESKNIINYETNLHLMHYANRKGIPIVETMATSVHIEKQHATLDR